MLNVVNAGGIGDNLAFDSDPPARGANGAEVTIRGRKLGGLNGLICTLFVSCTDPSMTVAAAVFGV